MLNISYEFRKGILFIRLEGILTKYTSNKLKREITDMIEDNKITNTVFNISKLSFIDKYGINNLLNNFKVCENNNGIALLCDDNKKINNIFNNNEYLKRHIIYDELSAFEKIKI